MGIYIYSGNEPYKIDAYRHKLLKDAQMPEMNVQRFYSDFSREVLDACMTAPFLSDKRYVILDLDAIKPLEGKAFTEYRKAPNASTELIIIVRKKPDERLKFTKALKKDGFLIPCDKVSSEQELEKVLLFELKKAGAVITSDALKEFTKRLNYFGLEYMNLNVMVGYLLNLVAVSKQITIETVQKFTPTFEEADRFKLAELIREHDMTELLRQLNMIDGESAIGVMSLLLSAFRVSYKSKYFDMKDRTKQRIVFKEYKSDILKECISVLTKDILAIKQGLMSNENALKHSCVSCARLLNK